MFEQGAGQLNVEGAVRLAKLVRQNLTANEPLGSNLLTTTMPPTAYTTIDGYTFYWGGGVVADHTFVYGTDLIMKYQKPYASGKGLGDGTLETNGVLVSDTTMFSNSVVVSDNILTTATAYWFPMDTSLLSCGVLVSDGV